MLKKFKKFFEPAPDFDLSFEPFVKSISDLNLQIMRANDSHLEDLLNLERLVYHGQTPWDKFSFRNELKKHHNSLYLVVYDGSKLVSFIGTRFNKEEAHITNIAVSPEYQRRGIASFLVSMMIDYAKQNDCALMSLEVRVDNDAALSVYKKMGFKADKVRENYYYTEKVDGLHMVQDLRPKNKQLKKE